jgi:hypothetical protein
MTDYEGRITMSEKEQGHSSEILHRQFEQMIKESANERARINGYSDNDYHPEDWENRDEDDD